MSMLQQAARRLLPGFAAGQQYAAFSKLAESTKLVGQEAGSPLMACSSTDDRSTNVAAPSVQIPVNLNIASMFAPKRAFHAGSALPRLGAASASFASAPALAAGLVKPPLGLGLGLTPRTPVGLQLPSAAAVRNSSYLTEGQVLGHAYLMATEIMFWSGLMGAVVFRRNLIVMLLCTEVVMLACNLNFLFAAAYLNDMTGVIMSITITTIAACETAIGLALCVTYFHLRSATDVEALNFLK